MVIPRIIQSRKNMFNKAAIHTNASKAEQRHRQFYAGNFKTAEDDQPA
jgi:hypothetical protein